MTDESSDQPISPQADDHPMTSDRMDETADEAPTEPTPPAAPGWGIPVPANLDPPRFGPPSPTPPNPWPPAVNTPNPGPPGWGSAPQGWPPPPPTAPIGAAGYRPGPIPGPAAPDIGAPGAEAPGMGAPGMGAPGMGAPGAGGPPHGMLPPGGNWHYNYGPATWGPPPGSSPPPAAARRVIAAIAVIVLVLASAGVGAAISSAMHSNNSASSTFPGSNGSQNGNGFFGNGNGASSSTGSGTRPSSAVVAKVDPSVVDIYTTLASTDGSGGEAAGTGMIISSDGEILTNNHVIDEATSIKVEVVDTGVTHTAKVVGYDVVDDVALLKMDGASGLKTVNFADASNVSIGDTVVAIGNAQGRGGTPAATAGSITALDQKVTAGDEGNGNSETLHGMIQMSAPIEPGDSGGPLVDTDGKVIGMNTAAAQSDDFFGQSGSSTAFAIPINKALGVVKQIRSGKDTNTVHVGERGILGVDIGQSSFPASGSGAAISQVQPNSPAESAGLAAGDTITAVNGKSVQSASDLTTLMFPYHPNDRVEVDWVDSSGQSHHARVKLIAGPLK